MDAWDDGLDFTAPVPKIIPLCDPEAKTRPKIPMDQEFTCYLCGAKSVTYRHLRVTPRPYELIQRPESGPISSVIEPTVTCGSWRCNREELRRQDVVFSHLIEPERVAYHEAKQKRSEKFKAERKAKQKEEDDV